MPQSEGGYVSLESGGGLGSVYNATTVPQNGGRQGTPSSRKTVLETVKKAIGQAISGHGSTALSSDHNSGGGDYHKIGSNERSMNDIGLMSGSNQDTASLLFPSNGNLRDSNGCHNKNPTKSYTESSKPAQIVSGLKERPHLTNGFSGSAEKPTVTTTNGRSLGDGFAPSTTATATTLHYKSNKALTSIRMPSAPTNSAEQARLLGTMPVDPMDDIELRSVQLQFPHARGSIDGVCDVRRIPTDKGDIVVAVQGDPHKPAILTYHDLGLNYATNFAGFFNYPTMRGLLDNFCVYHVNAPGQEEGALTLPDDYVYPTMDELASQLMFVMTSFGLKTVIGFGIGAGANILTRFAIQNPDKIGALCLINCSSTAAGWIEWGYQTFNARYLRTKGMTQGVIDYLMWHHFGRNWEERNHDLVQMYKAHFEKSVNPINLGMWIYAYIHRTDLNIARTPSSSSNTSSNISTLKMPVMNITADLCPHVDDTVTLNGRLDPTNSTWMKISDCAMVLEEQPGKLAEAFRLFLQGEGYAVGALHKLSRKPESVVLERKSEP